MNIAIRPNSILAQALGTATQPRAAVDEGPAFSAGVLDALNLVLGNH